jgi:hypothetical protein
MTATLTPRRAADTSNGYSIWLEVLLSVDLVRLWSR